MNRNLSQLSDTRFDLVIIGGGITGACLAMDAAMRGMKVALIEKDDFGAATSAASSKLLHGGIRYLQQLNFGKVRESAQERVYFQQLAPHLTRYVPFIIPTYKSFSKGRFVMQSAMWLYELICSGQDKMLTDASKKVPGSRVISQQEIGQLVPALQSDNITGGVVFYESHMHSSERMTLGFIETAQQHGACVANYVTVDGLLGAESGCVSGVSVSDRLSGEQFEIQASLVVNAAGPWIPLLNSKIQSSNAVAGVVNAFSKGAHIVTRQLTDGHAVALPTRKQNQAVINRGGRHVFIIPWRGCSLIGTTYGPYKGELDKIHASESDIEEMMADINSALGCEALQREHVQYAYAGIYPLIDDVINPNVYQGTGDYQIIDHAAVDQLDGLVSVFGAKYTTARLLAEKALDKIATRFDKTFAQCSTRHARLAAGDIEDLQRYREQQRRRYQPKFSAAVIDNLVTNYGTKLHQVIELAETDSALAEELLPGRHTLAAELVYSVRHEMACQLDDFVLRRTGLGTLGNPGEEVLRRCASLMAKELGWDQPRIENEILQTLNAFPADVVSG
jgi:glycerol-3-phosphate dehydrogenase